MKNSQTALSMQAFSGACVYTTVRIHTQVPHSKLGTGGKANTLPELKEFFLNCLYQTAPLCLFFFFFA